MLSLLCLSPIILLPFSWTYESTDLLRQENVWDLSILLKKTVVHLYTGPFYFQDVTFCACLQVIKFFHKHNLGDVHTQCFSRDKWHFLYANLRKQLYHGFC